MRKKVLFYAPMEYDNTAFWRINVLKYLSNSDYDVIDGSHIPDWNASTFTGINIFISHRPCMPNHFEMLTLASLARCKIIIDYDDNLFKVMDTNPTHLFYQDMRLNILKCLRITDEVWVTTDNLKEVYSKFCKSVVVIPNAWNNFLYPVEYKKKFNHDTKYVLWRGGSTHEEDLYENPDDIIRVIKRNPDFTFHFWGHCFTYINKRVRHLSNYVCKTAADPLQYFQNLFDYNPNIMIFPLAPNEFNKGKSSIVWMEATYAWAVLYSNKDLPEFDRDSILDIDNLDFDLETVHKLPDAYKYMENENEESWQYILDNLLLSKVNQVRHERIMELL